MKRSEMLEVIKQSLYCHLPGYKECPDFIAETVLQSIEAGGMLPPSYVYWNSKNPLDVNENGIPKDLQFSMNNGDNVNRWEKE